ncbi:MAG: YdiU family protein, partial [Sphaerochaetaceae bacterium]|nr:YdiU family protein [Sphaerochaetaceae bacterium]
PNLGDGRALNLGEFNKYHLQLKGSGQTPYSRDGDGRAVLRSSIREYLASEAMHALGIPSTRALGIIGSDTKVYREKTEQGAITLRLSPSWIRFGSFEFAYLGKNKTAQLRELADYVIDESFEDLKNHKNRYEELYYKIVDNTAQMIALWQSYGFMHGVMNTDNMSILGLTIDYGPYAFMEKFDKGFVCNLSDHEGRYSFENQPYMAGWNLQVLAKVFSQIANKDLLESYTSTFMGNYKKRYFKIMFKKLGFIDEKEGDRKLLSELLKAMQIDAIDYTSFFYRLSKKDFDSIEGENIRLWLEKYKTRTKKSLNTTTMQKVNPRYMLRNYMLQEAIEKAEIGDFTLVNQLLELIQNPFDEHKEFEDYTKADKNINNIRCSCSS